MALRSESLAADDRREAAAVLKRYAKELSRWRKPPAEIAEAVARLESQTLPHRECDLSGVIRAIVSSPLPE